MKEYFDDEKLYREDQKFAGACVRNYHKVLQNYNYGRYQIRFRALADTRKLSPKLCEQEFASLLTKLTEALAGVGETRLLESEKNQKLADRLLVATLFDVDWGA